MTYVVTTRTRPRDASDIPTVRDGVGSIVRPKLEQLGAKYVVGLELLTGDAVGVFAMGSGWESLDAYMEASKAFYADADVVAALEAAPTEVLGRAMGQIEGEAGQPQGGFAGVVMVRIASPGNIAELIDAAGRVATSSGCNGIRGIRVVAGGEEVGLYGTVIYTDSTDAFFTTTQNAYTDDVLPGMFSDMGVEIVSRAVARCH